MARMATLRQTVAELAALGADRRSGAAELAERAAALVEAFCRGQRRRDPRLPYALSALAEATLAAHPAMAPLLNLANLIQLAAEADGHALPTLRRSLAAYRRERQQAAKAIARRFARQVPRRATVLTYSYSSTVLAALAAARSRLARVIVSEGRPGYEGRVVAERLARMRVGVTLVSDAALSAQVEAADLVVVGADAVLARAYVNKVGTRPLQAQARARRQPFFVLADASKFLPAGLAGFHRLEAAPGEELWQDAPAGVVVLNRSFESIPFESGVTLLTERGALTPADVRARLARQPVARRFQTNGSTHR
jgi:ribose 1,5-bisphosphate isomerase